MSFAQPGKFHDSRDKVAVSVEMTPNEVTPGGDAILAITLHHEEHWHTHTNNPKIPEELGEEDE